MLKSNVKVSLKMLYSRDEKISGNIIKHNLRTSMNERNTFLYKNISLTLYSQEGWCFCSVWEMGGETYTQREDFFFPYLFPGARGCQRLHPLASRDTSDRLCVLRSIAILCTQSKSDRMVLIMWSPSSYIPVVPECPDRAVLFTNHNMTAFQSTRGH